MVALDGEEINIYIWMIALPVRVNAVSQLRRPAAGFAVSRVALHPATRQCRRQRGQRCLRKLPPSRSPAIIARRG